MHVAFSAFRGIGSERRGQDAIQTGDGEYQETWISPQQWRREVTLGRYHAVEVRTDGVRKFQVTSDYEPSRVLMLLDALLFPIPRNLVTPELNQKPVDWNIRDIGSGQVPYVLISGAGAAHIYVYGFLEGGMLFRSGRAGLLMNWSKPIRFGKYLVPAEIAISALGTDLLRATVSIEAIDGDRLENFDILGSPANPGATLRPLHWFDVESARLDSHRYDLPGDSLVHGIVHTVIDRHGQLREVEAVDGPIDKSIIENLVTRTERDRWRPPTVDGSPCEEMVDYVW